MRCYDYYMQHVPDVGDEVHDNIVKRERQRTSATKKEGKLPKHVDPQEKAFIRVDVPDPVQVLQRIACHPKRRARIPGQPRASRAKSARPGQVAVPKALTAPPVALDEELVVSDIDIDLVPAQEVHDSQSDDGLWPCNMDSPE